MVARAVSTDGAVILMIASFVSGAIIGSFLNVCIVRLPTGESVVTPRSRCPHCRTPIRARDNIPIVSYVFLRGRCRACATPISPRYVLVEVLTGAAAVAAFLLHGSSAHTIVAFVFLSALIVITFIDLDHQIIPNVITVPGIGLGFGAALLLGQPSWQASLAGIVLGGGLLWVVAEAYYWLTGREGMGGGDVKLLAMVGAFLGWKAIPVTVLLASVVGVLGGVAAILLAGRSARAHIPFGPFLAGGAACALFFGDPLLHWYLDWSAR